MAPGGGRANVHRRRPDLGARPDRALARPLPCAAATVGRARIFRWDPGKLLGTSALTGLNPEDRPRVEQVVATLKNRQAGEARIIYRSPHREKGEIWVEITFRVTRCVATFAAWMRKHNEGKPAGERAGFSGLDIYNMRSSIAAVLAYLDGVDPQAAAVARERYGCLTPWPREPSTYGRAVLTEGHRKCEAEILRQCQDVLKKKLEYAASDPDGFLDAARNARLIASAERYYRIMYYGGAESWNLRDTHMFETLGHILDAQGSRSKAVIWAHNSHIGDARFTEMGAVRDELNIGQLCREKFGDAASLIGFGTHTGTVAAASDWDGEMEVMQVRPSRPDSYERLFHDAGAASGLLEFRRDESLRRRLIEPRLDQVRRTQQRPAHETVRTGAARHRSLPAPQRRRVAGLAARSDERERSANDGCCPTGQARVTSRANS
ncbi:erythromycin esterase-like protein [Bradyrhizobium sp. LB9.1b]